MINRIKNFLCTVDPIAVAGLIILVGLIGLEIYLMGIVKFLLIVGTGLSLGVLVFAIGWLIYKGIVLLQRSYCE